VLAVRLCPAGLGSLLGWGGWLVDVCTARIHGWAGVICLCFMIDCYWGWDWGWLGMLLSGVRLGFTVFIN